MSNYQYEERERREAHNRIEEVRKAPLEERRENTDAFFKAMRDNPDLVGERVGWLLNGSYGYGSMKMAEQILNSPRMNRVAALTQMVGVFEWLAPEEMTRQAWKRLSGEEKAALKDAVEEAIDDAEDED